MYYYSLVWLLKGSPGNSFDEICAFPTNVVLNDQTQRQFVTVFSIKNIIMTLLVGVWGVFSCKRHPAFVNGFTKKCIAIVCCQMATRSRGIHGDAKTNVKTLSINLSSARIWSKHGNLNLIPAVIYWRVGWILSRSHSWITNKFSFHGKWWILALDLKMSKL